ncbi:energy transducer TonB [Loktanella sp. Alg231-35]|uniref:energy transducer TonB n=1 Tax=Loktanella sp. Alg231-35 TaxID=1922220 RepID=UPI000D552D60|nr:energy transducer TonB [Loktanella sp. Alg231-35]
MATPGTFISAVGHSGLIVWLILGWGFDAEPLQIETMDVSVISGEEFEQLRARTTPDPGAADPEAPVPPEIDETPPPPPADEEPTETAPPPEPVEQPVEETPPPPPPEPLVTEADDQPPPEPAAPADPPPTPDVEVSEEATPPQAPTVTSQITAPPPPDANVDDIVREEVVPDDSAEPEVVAEEQDATAPEETTTAIVIEDLAPSTSVRPSPRPSRPTPQPEPEVEVTETATEQPAPPEPAQSEDDVAAALEAALGATEAPAAAAGPPMTGSERDSFRVSVNRCWNVDPGSVAARVTVEVGFSLDREGKVQGNDVRLISSDGDQSATNTAFEAARRAILRCQSGGYELPADKYDQWKDVVITFDPSGMRLR